MAEIISDDVFEWARDLAAMRRLLAGEKLPNPDVPQSVTILPFAPRQPLQNPLGQSKDMDPIANR